MNLAKPLAATGDRHRAGACLAAGPAMKRALGMVLVLIFMLSVPSRVGAQTFDYAERPEYRDESRHDDSRGLVDLEVSSHEDSVREIPLRLTERRWYSDETLALDGAAAVTAAFAMAARSEAWAVSGPVYLLGAPVVHFVHDRPLAGLASIGMRLVLPVLGGAVSQGLNERECRDCFGFSKEFVAGFFMGASIAMGLDALLLANEEVVVERPQASFAPWMNVTRTGVAGGVEGAFRSSPFCEAVGSSVRSVDGASDGSMRRVAKSS
jgi:hypothetical protein